MKTPTPENLATVRVVYLMPWTLHYVGIVRVSPKQLEIHGRSSGRVIHRPTHGLHGTEVRWTPLVFATPEAALEEYAAQRYDDIERGKRRIERATQLRTHALALLHSIQLEKRSS